MVMVQMSRILVFSLLYILVSISQVDSQSNWRIFSPPDKSFTVELPRTPKFQRKKVNPRKDALFENTIMGDAYTFRLRQNDPESVFSISVFYLSAPVNNQLFNQRAKSLALIIGGDKEDSDFTKKADVRVNGFHGREFIYEKGVISGRALFINAGKRIYFLLYHTDVEGEISSETIVRIFETFKPAL